MSSGYTTKQDGMISGNNVVPWMGRTDYVQILPGLLTRQVIEASPKINFKVRKVAAYFNPFGQDVCYAQRFLADSKDDKERAQAEKSYQVIAPSDYEGKMKRGDDNFHIIREDTQTSLGVVGNRYYPIQNAEGLDVLDPVIGKGAAYETAGSLHGGKVVWLLAKVQKEWTIGKGKNRDKFDQYILIYLSHDGSKPVTVRFVKIRVVCANTLAAAISGIKAEFIIRHTRNYQDKIEEAHRIMGLNDKHQQAFEAEMLKLADAALPEKQARAFLETLLPAKRGDDDKLVVSGKLEGMRDDIFDLFQKGTGNKGKTRYDMLNGVTEYADHGKTFRVSSNRSEEDSRFETTMFGSGHRLKNQACELLTTVKTFSLN